MNNIMYHKQCMEKKSTILIMLNIQKIKKIMLSAQISRKVMCFRQKQHRECSDAVKAIEIIP